MRLWELGIILTIFKRGSIFPSSSIMSNEPMKTAKNQGHYIENRRKSLLLSCFGSWGFYWICCMFHTTSDWALWVLVSVCGHTSRGPCSCFMNLRLDTDCVYIYYISAPLESSSPFKHLENTSVLLLNEWLLLLMETAALGLTAAQEDVNGRLLNGCS